MAGLSLSLWVLQPLVAGRFLGLGGMRVAYTITSHKYTATLMGLLKVLV